MKIEVLTVLELSHAQIMHIQMHVKYKAKAVVSKSKVMGTNGQA